MNKTNDSVGLNSRSQESPLQAIGVDVKKGMQEVVRSHDQLDAMHRVPPVKQETKSNIYVNKERKKDALEAELKKEVIVSRSYDYRSTNPVIVEQSMEK